MRRLTSAPKTASPVVAGAKAVAHAIELGEVARRLRGEDEVVRTERVVEVRAGDLDDLGPEPLQHVDGLREALRDACLVAVAAEFLDQPDAQTAHIAAPPPRHREPPR